MSTLLGPAGLLGGGRRLAVAAVALYAVVSVGIALPPAAEQPRRSEQGVHRLAPTRPDAAGLRRRRPSSSSTAARG